MNFENPLWVQFNRENINELVGFDRSKMTPGIVHFGSGNFARALFFDRINEILKTDPRWGIRAVTQTNRELKAALEAQDCVYPLIEQSDKGHNTKFIGSVHDVTVAEDEPKKVIEMIADPGIKLITMTITEGGYPYSTETGNLNFDDPKIKGCLRNMDEPRTVTGLINAGLKLRQKTGAGPITVMSLDNLNNNSTVFKNGLFAFMNEAGDQPVIDYTHKNVTFPATGVNRITPKTEEEYQIINDPNTLNWPVITSPLPTDHLVIENNFAGEMPDLASAGAIILDDVRPYKNMKVRLLNGAHMAIGCIGKIAGYDTVYEAISDPKIDKFMLNFLEEVKYTLGNYPELNYDEYAKNEVLKPLKNPKIEDHLTRLVRKGTKDKLNPRLLTALEDAITHNTGHEHLAFAVASWMHYLKGGDNNGNSFDIIDPVAEELNLPEISKNAGMDPSGIIGASGVFSNHLQGSPTFQESINRHFRNIREHGMLNALNMVTGPQIVAGVNQQMTAQDPMKQQLK